MSDTHPKTKMGAALSRRQRRQWNRYVSEMKWHFSDKLADCTRDDEYANNLAVKLKNMILALPVFDEDGKGCSWGGDYWVFNEDKPTTSKQRLKI